MTNEDIELLTKETFPVSIFYAGDQNSDEHWISSNVYKYWTDNPLGVDEKYPYEFCCTRYYTYTSEPDENGERHLKADLTKGWKPWDTKNIALWSHFGQDASPYKLYLDNSNEFFYYIDNANNNYPNYVILDKDGVTTGNISLQGGKGDTAEIQNLPINKLCIVYNNKEYDFSESGAIKEIDFGNGEIWKFLANLNLLNFWNIDLIGIGELADSSKRDDLPTIIKGKLDANDKLFEADLLKFSRKIIIKAENHKENLTKLAIWTVSAIRDKDGDGIRRYRITPDVSRLVEVLHLQRNSATPNDFNIVEQIYNTGDKENQGEITFKVEEDSFGKAWSPISKPYKIKISSIKGGNIVTLINENSVDVSDLIKAANTQDNSKVKSSLRQYYIKLCVLDWDYDPNYQPGKESDPAYADLYFEVDSCDFTYETIVSFSGKDGEDGKNGSASSFLGQAARIRAWNSTDFYYPIIGSLSEVKEYQDTLKDLIDNESLPETDISYITEEGKSYIYPKCYDIVYMSGTSTKERVADMYQAIAICHGESDEPSEDSEKWVKAESFDFLAANSAYIENLASSSISTEKLIITDGGHPVAGLINGLEIFKNESITGADNVVFFSGFDGKNKKNLEESTFYVTKGGEAHIQGSVNASSFSVNKDIGLGDFDLGLPNNRMWITTYGRILGNNGIEALKGKTILGLKTSLNDDTPIILMALLIGLDDTDIDSYDFFVLSPLNLNNGGSGTYYKLRCAGVESITLGQLKNSKITDITQYFRFLPVGGTAIYKDTYNAEYLQNSEVYADMSMIQMSDLSSWRSSAVIFTINIGGNEYFNTLINKYTFYEVEGFTRDKITPYTRNKINLPQHSILTTSVGGFGVSCSLLDNGLDNGSGKYYQAYWYKVYLGSECKGLLLSWNNSFYCIHDNSGVYNLSRVTELPLEGTSYLFDKVCINKVTTINNKALLESLKA